MSAFDVPFVPENVDGWGPSGVPEKFRDLPYQPFSKSDQLGKIADWTGSVYTNKHAAKYTTQFAPGVQYAYHHDEDDNEFQLVDTAKPLRPGQYPRSRIRFYPNRRQPQQQQQGNQQQAPGAHQLQTMTRAQMNAERQRQRQIRRYMKLFGRQLQENKNKAQHKNREAAIKIRETWQVVEDMDFPRFARLSLHVEAPQTLLACGWLGVYDKSFDRVNTRSGCTLRSYNRTVHRASTSDDPVIRDMAKNDEGNVFLTDALIACLMCATRSVYSWAIWAHKIAGPKGPIIFFDMPADSNLDMPTVNENATDPPPHQKDIKDPKNIDKHFKDSNTVEYLRREAVYINHNFAHTVLRLDDKPYFFSRPNPFDKTNDIKNTASVAYRYQRWNLGNGIRLVCRCELNGVQLAGGEEPEMLFIRALNEYESRSEAMSWRTKLDTQPGSVLAIELKNNIFKLSKWTAQALLVGADQLKLGYVSRNRPEDSSSHVILGVQQFKPDDLARQINLSISNCWGVVRSIIDILLAKDDGKYLIMKDPNKQTIHIYYTPQDDEVDNSEDDDSDSEDDSDDADAVQPE